MSILHKFDGLDHLVLTVPVSGGSCSTCHLYRDTFGCTKKCSDGQCDVIMKEEDGTDLYVFKGLVER